MRKYLLLIALVAGCGASDKGERNLSAARDGKPARTASADAQAGLTGLYEGGAASAPSQLCVVGKGGQAHFGMVIWGANLSACGGAGVVEQDGDRLRFRMTGDQACTVEAKISGGRISLANSVAPGCSYYCGARVSFEGATFDRKGSSLADAMKAKDPAGDPLCSG